MWHILFLLIALSAPLKGEVQNKVLVLHSYHQGLMWTDQVSKGILRAFIEYPEYELEYRYLNARKTIDQGLLDKQKAIITREIANNHYKAIIVSDNAAFDYIKTVDDSIVGQTPIICCGINGQGIPPFSEHCYIIHEEVDYSETFSMIAKLLPNLETVLVLNDRSQVGQLMQQEIEEELGAQYWPFDIAYYNDFSMAKLLDSISQLNDNTALFLLVFNKDNEGQYLSYNYALRAITQAASVPIFGAWNFYMNKGILGGKITSGQNHGRVAAKACIKLLKHDELNAEDLKAENKYRADYSVMRQYGLKASALPKGTYITNKPDRKLFVRLFYALLLLFIAILFVYHRNEKYLRRTVYKRTRELKLSLNHKDQFFSLLAHDLRSPIGNIAESLRYLEQKGDRLTAERRDLLLRELSKTSSRVYHLLEDLLVWGRFQFSSHYEANTSVFNLRSIVDDVCELYHLEKDRSLLKNSVSPKIELLNDAFVFKFILRNLISNAIKYAPKDSTISIGAKQDGPVTSFWVKDEGQGMTQDVIDSIINNKPIQSQGIKGQKSFGLGLNSVQAYLKQINGQIRIESTPEQGSCFYIILSPKGTKPSPPKP